MSLSAFEKRVKRHVTAPLRRFYAATAPGLESLCLRELGAILPGLPMQPVGGGVEFTGRLHDAYLANLCLRTANRVLLRIDAFNATSFASLEKRAAKIPWELYLPGRSSLRFQVTVRRSRLYHSDAVAERLANAIQKRLLETASAGDGAAADQTVFVRLVRDRLTLSLDSSGPNLHRRGLKTHVTAAPLRETTAAAALMMAGYTPSEPMLDPMCGSGTFSIEAALIALHIPPGWFRDFAFTRWPAFAINSKRWQYLRSQKEKEILPPGQPIIFASDSRETACAALRKNTAHFDLKRSIRIDRRDFFDLLPADGDGRTGLLALNPPFGRRLGSDADSDRLFRKSMQKLGQAFRGWKVALIVPRRYLLDAIPFKVQAHRVAMGGLNLYIATGKID
jgi:putative N6-adenine-specific DNA methylase